jgi:predicted AAA+ superfamily ATPase
MAEYRARITDGELATRLRAAGAVLLEGPKACGKTETARRQAASVVLLDVDQAAQTAARIDPLVVLEGETPRLLDEWQVVPEVWNAVRRQVDERGADGQFILTGSATPADDITRHTGAGRIARLRMRTMTLHETGHSSGTASLSVLLGETFTSCPDPGLALDDLIELVCRGGWPAALRRSLPDAQQSVTDYLEEIRRTDIHTVDGVRRDPARVRAVLVALARNVATQVAISTLATDTGALLDTGTRPREETVADYLAALERLMIIEDQPAWAPHLRSRSLVRGAPKRHFVDPSLAVAALGARPADLRADLNLFGFLFESLVIRDLRVFAQPLGAEIRHYRDNTGLEVDAVVTAGNDRWGAFEIKLGASRTVVDQAAATLLKFAARVDTSKCGEPAVLAVIVGNGYGYTRPDGVAVVPIGALCP